MNRILRKLPVEALVIATVGLSAFAIAASWTGSHEHRMWLWCAACIVGEMLWLRLPLDRATLSMAASFNFAALLLLSRGEAMVAIALSILVAELLIVRKPPIRACFNAAQTSLAAGAASWAFALLSGRNPGAPAPMVSPDALALFAAAATYYFVNRAAVSLVIGLHQQTSPLAAWRANFGSRHELLASVVLFALGVLVAAGYQRLGMLGVALAVIPMRIAFDAYRRHLESDINMADPGTRAGAPA